MSNRPGRKMGHAVSPETRAKIGAATRGRKVSPETRAKMRVANVGRTWGKGRLTNGYTIGDTKPLYHLWHTMRQRCSNPKHKSYKHYGGRGISVDERWDDFGNFLEDMGMKPDGMSLNRIDNDGNYEPGNVRWATPAEQTANRRGATR